MTKKQCSNCKYWDRTNSGYYRDCPKKKTFTTGSDTCKKHGKLVKIIQTDIAKIAKEVSLNFQKNINSVELAERLRK